MPSRKTTPILDPNRELPQPHDMQLEASQSETNSPEEKENIKVSPSKQPIRVAVLILILLIVSLLGYITYILISSNNPNKDATSMSLFSLFDSHSSDNWKVFTNEDYGYTIKYPEELLVTGDRTFTDSIGFGDYISASVWESDYRCDDCLEEKITSTENVQIGNNVFIKKTGTIRDTEDPEVYYEPPQSFITYEITKGSLRYELTIYELPTDTTEAYDVQTKFPPNRVIGKVPEKDLKILEKMLDTMTFSQPKKTTVVMDQPTNYNEFENTGDSWRTITLASFKIGLPPQWKLLDDTQMITLTPPDQEQPIITIAGEIGQFPYKSDSSTAVTYSSTVIDGMNAGLQRERSLYSNNDLEEITTQVRTNSGTWSFTLLNPEYEKEYMAILQSVSFLKKDTTIVKNTFTVADAYKGMTVGGMRISSIEPYVPTFTKNEVNAKITFSGKTTISGTYYYDQGDPNGEICFSTLSANSLDSLPKIKGDGRSIWLCLTNSTAASKFLSPAGQSGQATIVIDSFTINRTTHEISDTARFVEVIKETVTPSITQKVQR